MQIACVLSEGFEDSEFRQPYDAFIAAGHRVTVIGAEAGSELKGKAGKETATVDHGIAGADPGGFDALFIPGGYSPDHLRADQRFVTFTKSFFEAGRPVFAICHGPQLLISAGVVEGRRMTAWQTIQVDLRGFGAEVVDEEVVVDRQLVTARKPADIPAFIRAALDLLRVPAGAPR